MMSHALRLFSLFFERRPPGPHRRYCRDPGGASPYGLRAERTPSLTNKDKNSLEDYKKHLHPLPLVVPIVFEVIVLIYVDTTYFVEARASRCRCVGRGKATAKHREMSPSPSEVEVELEEEGE